MTRTTRKDAEAAFGRLCLALGKDTNDTVLTAERTPTGGIVYAGNVGAWRLSWNFNGRCGIEEITSPAWSVSLPFGYRIYTPAEFVDCVGFLLCGLEHERERAKAHRRYYQDDPQESDKDRLVHAHFGMGGKVAGDE